MSSACKKLGSCQDERCTFIDLRITGHVATRKFHHQPTRHQGTPRHQPTRHQAKSPHHQAKSPRHQP